MFVQKTAIDPRPFSRCDFRLRQARFHSEERPMEGGKLYDLYKATEPPREWFPELLLHARKIGITIFSSVFSPEDVDLEQFNPPAYKIASADRAFALWSKSRRAKCITWPVPRAGERWPRLLPGRAAASVFTATTFVRRRKKPTSI